MDKGRKLNEILVIDPGNNFSSSLVILWLLDCVVADMTEKWISERNLEHSTDKTHDSVVDSYLV